MLKSNLMRERVAWLALVVVLATTASWLAAITVALAARQAAVVTPEYVVAGKALLRVVWMLVREAAPAALIAVLISGLIGLAWLSRREQQVKEEARHA